jgi:heme exporter protein A
MLTPASQGSLQLFGEDSAGNSAALRGRIGLIGHQSMLYRDLTARENLIFFGRLYGLKNVAARVEHMLEVVDLADRGDDEVKAFSRGMTQRLAIARALLHEPQLLLADEPFAGLDVASVDALETLLRQLHQDGRTVVLVNHDIAQSLRLAQRVVVLRQGTIALDQFCGMLTAGDVLAEVKP